jgi:5-methylcytosine-specific restriction endonuclease McrA
MLTDERVSEICVQNNYEYNKALGICMETLKEFIFKTSPIPTLIKSKIASIIGAKIPYSFYGLEKIELTYDELKHRVQGMDGTRVSDNIGYHTVMYVNYEEAKEALKSGIRSLKSTVFTSSKSKLNTELFGYPINLRINHITLFRHDVCFCDICKTKVRYVTIDKDDKEDNYKITLWTVDETNTPIRMTVDHKIARGLGGKNWLKNMVPMCEVCNQKKSTIESRIANHNRDVEKVHNAEIYPFQCSFYQ